ncbi:hypothetical protein PCC7418_2404 [Halothece sp. PCC 7418]|uniref:hypothetical protein n=1 Tax=Halothece sp. (strain PCC 7418) TaxID=65093 RepID=UPI0002A08553|nr:hypothetical protein [Halothece sp. PCC 7418]AFZ44551.1 hypothetical protein PCC7418_2404 [Halothece sp. PCC 7418]
MERGLIWLPLLALFIGLAWAGWNEYQKVEAYRNWAEQFDRAKYDIYAVLGQKDDKITWGKPTRGIPEALQTFSLHDVAEIKLLVDETPVVLDNPPRKGKPAIQFAFPNSENVEIPFTDISLAARWTEKLQELASH